MYLIIIGVAVAVIMVPSFYVILFKVRFKARNKRFVKYCDEFAEELQNQGVDTAYDGYTNSELLALHKEFDEKSNQLNVKKDWKEFVEIGCREKIVNDILKKRGLQIPEWE